MIYQSRAETERSQDLRKMEMRGRVEDRKSLSFHLEESDVILESPNVSYLLTTSDATSLPIKASTRAQQLSSA